MKSRIVISVLGLLFLAACGGASGNAGGPAENLDLSTYDSTSESDSRSRYKIASAQTSAVSTGLADISAVTVNEDGTANFSWSIKKETAHYRISFEISSDSKPAHQDDVIYSYVCGLPETSSCSFNVTASVQPKVESAEGTYYLLARVCDSDGCEEPVTLGSADVTQ